MTPPVFFNALLLLCVAHALLRGGAPEKAGAVMMIVAAITTRITLTEFERRFAAPEIGVFVTDVALLAGLYFLALRSNRIWPMVTTALQLSSIFIHLAKVADLTMAPWVYQFMLKIWSYPMILLLVVGGEVHRWHLKKFGVDRAWSQ